MALSERQIGTHVSHCCAQHGCKYGDDKHGDEGCPVVAKTHEQSSACEQCSSTATIEARIAYLQQELEWSKSLEARGLRIFGYDDDWVA